MSVQRDRGLRRGVEIAGVLDVGSSKIACLIAAIDPDAPAAGPRPRLRVIGVGHQRSQGVKSGLIANLDQAEEAIRQTIGQAERMASVTLPDVLVSVSCGRLQSQSFQASSDVATGVVTAADIARLMEGGRAYAERDGRALVHMNRVGYRLDGAAAAVDPLGLAARKLSAGLHAVTADEAPIRNLLHVVQRCHLGASRLILGPYASAIASTTEEERRLGVTVVDIGGGATTLAIFAEGEMVHADAFPVGGQHVTFDIARGLQTPLAEAERIKALYGTLVVAPSDEHEAITYPLAGEEEGAGARVTRAELREIIRPRAIGHMMLLRDRLETEAVQQYWPGRIVLTGGGSQLAGLADCAASILGCPTRGSRPHAISGLPQAVSCPEFATAAGLLIAALPETGASIEYHDGPPGEGGYLGRVGHWLKSGF